MERILAIQNIQVNLKKKFDECNESIKHQSVLPLFILPPSKNAEVISAKDLKAYKREWVQKILSMHSKKVCTHGTTETCDHPRFMKADFVRNLYSIKFGPVDVGQISISDYNDAELTKIISAQPLILGPYSEQIQDAPTVQEVVETLLPNLPESENTNDQYVLFVIYFRIYYPMLITRQ
jgi:hypothetical protein